MKPYFLLFAIAYSYCSNANCLLTKVPIDSRVKNSETIIDGTVTDQHSCWNSDKTAIYTVNTIQVNGILKGSSATTIQIITPGGELDGKMLVVEPNADLKKGAKGIFFLNNNTVGLNFSSSLKQYEIHALAQGFIELNPITGKYNDPFDEYQDKSSLYSLIQNVTGINYRFSNPDLTIAEDNTGDPAITLYTPATISAGTQSVLTINGWGFGTRTGTATVQFRDANSTSPSVFASVPDSTYILSWTNSEIKVIVPGASINRQGGAGTGTFNVITSTGYTVSSITPLNITYNQFEYKKNKISLIDQNGLGGYTFTFNTDFNNNTPVKESFLRALDQWKCKTGINIAINSNTTATTCSNQIDNSNVISFATASCPLPSGALAMTYSSYTLCSGSPIIPDGIDIVVNPNVNFNYGTGAPSSNQYDFETVILHELGHAFGQGHSSVNAEIMYPSISYGIAKRTLNNNTDLLSVNDVVSRSIAASSCGYLKHKKLTTSCNAVQITPISSQFITDKTTGCAPLTVKFTDLSSGAPTQWRWDISNNGTVDYTIQNPTHTFTTAGTYTVKLTALNSNTQDSVVKTAVITVAPTLNLNIDVLQNVSCNGGNNGSLKALPTGGNGVYTYSWSNNQTNQTLSNMAAGTYTVTLRDGYNCIATGTKTITQPDPISLNVNTQLVSGDKYSATFNVTGGTTPYTFTLNNSTEQTNPTIQNLTPGNYALVVKDKNSCLKNTSFSIASPTPVNETETQFEALDVYPNPATNNVTLNFALKDNKTVKVELFDLSGQSIFQDEYQNIRDKQTSIDLSALASGTYLLRFGLPEGNTYRKIIVNR